MWEWIPNLGDESNSVNLSDEWDCSNSYSSTYEAWVRKWHQCWYYATKVNFIRILKGFPVHLAPPAVCFAFFLEMSQYTSSLPTMGFMVLAMLLVGITWVLKMSYAPLTRLPWESCWWVRSRCCQYSHCENKAHFPEYGFEAKFPAFLHLPGGSSYNGFACPWHG